MKKYKNIFTGLFIYNDNEPINYKRYKIYYREEKYDDLICPIYDIVKNNICVGMYHGINGAKKEIDTILLYK